jgi:hypothetical protein
MDQQVDIQRLSPDKQLEGFSRSRLLPYFVLAIIIHVVLILGTSVGMIMGFIDPQAAAEAKAAEEAAAAEEKAAKADEGKSTSLDEEGVTAEDDQATTNGAEAGVADETEEQPEVANQEYVEGLNESEAPPDNLDEGGNLDDKLDMDL